MTVVRKSTRKQKALSDDRSEPSQFEQKIPESRISGAGSSVDLGMASAHGAETTGAGYGLWVRDGYTRDHTLSKSKEDRDGKS